MSYYNRLITVVMLTFLFTFALLFILLPEQSFSAIENRMLQTKPILRWRHILSGDFSQEAEQYVADQFACRQLWVALKVKAERFLQKKEHKGVYFGNEGYLLQILFAQNEAQFRENLAAINAFASMSPAQVYLLQAPTAVQVLLDKLPAFAPPPPDFFLTAEVKQLLKPNIQFIDISAKLFNHRQEEIYFRTDHHWTMLGAYYAYQKAGEVMGFKPLRRDQFKVETVDDQFWGSLATKCGTQLGQPDNLKLFLPQENLNPRVEYIQENKTTATFYAKENLNTRDKYAVFFDGNHALIKISLPNGKSRKLLVVKDSYANALLPFLAHHYDEIHVVDLRYFHESLTAYCQQHKFNEVLLLYNTMTLSTEASLRKLTI